MTETKGLIAHVWTDENAVFESLVVLDENNIYIANPDESNLTEIAEQIQSGASPASVIENTKVKQIPFDNLKHIKSNRYSTAVDYKFINVDGKDKTDNFTMKQEDRNDLFMKLDILCSRGFQYTETQFNKFRAAVKPLITISIVALLTLISYNAAVQIAEEGPGEIHGRHVLIKRLFAWLLDVLGPIGVVIVGGFIAALCCIWLAKRIATPPLILEYKKSNV